MILRRTLKRSRRIKMRTGEWLARLRPSSERLKIWHLTM